MATIRDLRAGPGITLTADAAAKTLTVQVDTDQVFGRDAGVAGPALIGRTEAGEGGAAELTVAQVRDLLAAVVSALGATTPGQVVLYADAAGREIQPATGTGYPRLQGGVLEVDGVVLPTSAETSGALTRASAGRMVRATAGCTINAGAFMAGDAVSIRNTTASAITITAGAGMTVEKAGTTGTGNVTLAGKGVCTYWFDSSALAICSGAGVT